MSKDGKQSTPTKRYGLYHARWKVRPIATKRTLLLVMIGAALISTSHAAPWSVTFGECIFTGDTSGSDLVRTGSCPTQSGMLELKDKGITNIKSNHFSDMIACT
jgi:hypothetical protein